MTVGVQGDSVGFKVTVADGMGCSVRRLLLTVAPCASPP
jgi:hypothetical protein